MIKILILGGGFGGVRCALDLEKRFKESVQKEKSGQTEITLIDRNNYHLFVPSIYEVASAYGVKKDPFSIKLRKTVSIPYSEIFDNRDINFVQAEVSDIDLRDKKVTTRGGSILDYDYLVLALGSEVNDFNISGVRDYAHQFKTLNDAIFINQKLEELSEEFRERKRTEPFSFLICGGGFTGVELASELGCCSRVIKAKCRLKGRCSTITIFEAGPKILPAITVSERTMIKKRLTHLGIIAIENSPIEEVGSDFVKLQNGHKVRGDLIIWTAGVKPSEMLRAVEDLPISQSGKIPVSESLLVKEHSNIFALGDSAEFMDPKTQRPIPALAYLASAEAKIIAQNIYNSVRNKTLKKYKPYYNMWVIPVGGKYALAHISNIFTATGLFGWLIRSAIDFRYFFSILPTVKALKLYWSEMIVFLKND